MSENFDGRAQSWAPRKRHVWRWIAAGLLILTSLVAAAIWAADMWEHHWRMITITADGAEQEVRVDVTLGALMAEHDDFGHGPGRLLSITDTVLDRTGGMPMTVWLNGDQIADSERAETALPEHGELSIVSGGDIVEAHEIRHDPEPHGVSLTGRGAIQELRQLGRTAFVRSGWVCSPARRSIGV